MANVSGRQYGVGMRYATVFALNESGSPAATTGNSGETAYSGIQMVGSKTFNLTIPDPVKISHVGDDRVLQVDYLPSKEAISGDLTVAEENQTLLALLSGTNQVVVGESTLVGLGTSEQGFEPQVGLLLYQQALDESGIRQWRYALLPKATLYAHPGGFSENPAEHQYIISPAVVDAHLWETAFADETEGFTEAQALIGQSRYRPGVDSWLASTATTTFLLSRTCANTAKLAIWVDGVAQTNGVTIGTTSLEFTTAPGNAKRVVCFYEHL